MAEREMSVLEKMARAISQASDLDPDYVNLTGDPEWMSWRHEARAILRGLGLTDADMQKPASAWAVVPVQSVVRHKKRGTTYQVLGVGRAQAATPIGDDDPVAIYRGSDGGLWCRHYAEFADGRFEVISARPGAARDE